MNDSRFDALTKRLSRRAAVGGVGASLAALSLGNVAAQDATPVEPIAGATPVATDDVELLFIQGAGATTLAPGTGDVHTLTMSVATAQTLYFSNRPNRVTGAMPTETFVAAFPAAFGDDPPNAALVGHLDSGADEEEVVVLELMNPTYDVASGTLSYEVVLLSADTVTEGAYESEPLSALDATREYSEAHLFIDDVDPTIQEECKQMCSRYLPPPGMIDPAGIGQTMYWNCLFGCMAQGGS